MRRARACFLAIFFLPVFGSSQSVTGYWYGSAFISGEDGDQNSYMIELILTENGKNVQGILNYYFLNTYRSIPITATFDRNQQALTFKDIPFVYYGSNPQMDVDCFMDGRFSLVMARAGTTLSGQWKPNPDYKNTCPPIQARLTLDKEQKITDSLLQAIKILKDNYQVWTPPPSNTGQVVKKGQSPPAPVALIKDTVVLKPSTVSKPTAPTQDKTAQKRPASKSKPFSKIKQLFKGKKSANKEPAANRLASKVKDRTAGNELRRSNAARTIDKEQKGVLMRHSSKTSIRSIEVVQELELDLDSVLISLYDNGEVDGDSISVLFNDTRIINSQLLSARPIQFSIQLDSLVENVELIMVAENLGSIPPNTAMMYVTAGEKTYQILLSSSLDKSASVRIKRKRKGLRIRSSGLK